MTLKCKNKLSSQCYEYLNSLKSGQYSSLNIPRQIRNTFNPKKERIVNDIITCNMKDSINGKCSYNKGGKHICPTYSEIDENNKKTSFCYGKASKKNKPDCKGNYYLWSKEEVCCPKLTKNN
jgi:hypothetical protein